MGKKPERRLRRQLVRLFCALFGYQSFLVPVFLIWWVLLAIMVALTIELLITGDYRIPLQP